MTTAKKDDRLPLDQIHIGNGKRCPFCHGTMERDGIMDGSRYDDQCSRPWYTCDTCGEGLDGEEYRNLTRGH